MVTIWLLTLLPLTTALTIPPQNLIYPSLNLSAPDAIQILNHTSSNSSALNASSLGNPTVSCNDQRYPSVVHDSCLNAWEKIPFYEVPGGWSVDFRSRFRLPPPVPINIVWVVSCIFTRAEVRWTGSGWVCTWHEVSNSVSFHWLYHLCGQWSTQRQ